MEWRSGVSASSGSAGIVGRAERAIRILGQLGVAVRPGTRLANATRFLEDVRRDRDLDDPDVREAVRDAHKTAWEFYLIACAAWLKRERENNPFPKSKLELALTGADLESVDRNSTARDTQFELLVAALLSLGGAEVSFGEPDLRLLFWKEHVGLAAKRMRSNKTSAIMKRVLEGADQIERRRINGFVVLNLDVLLSGAALENATERRHDQLAERLAVIQEVGRRRLRDKYHVKGIIVLASVANWNFDEIPPALTSTYALVHYLIADHPDDEDKGKMFFHGLASRIDNAIARL